MTCLHNSLVCDGYAHCLDWSDEQEESGICHQRLSQAKHPLFQDLCSNCARGKYFPMREQTSGWTYSFQERLYCKQRQFRFIVIFFQCLHRYTGLSICASPCDGLDDLCVDNADEDGCSFYLPFVYIMAGAMCLQLGLIAALELVEQCRKMCCLKDGDGEMVHIITSNYLQIFYST